MESFRQNPSSSSRICERRFLERYDNQFKVNLYITADTAYWYDQNLWELRGRVRVRNLENGTLYRSQQLFWDMSRHEFYSNVYMHITTPDRDIQGDRFRSDEQLMRYEVIRSRGFIPLPKSMNSSAADRNTLESAQQASASETPTPPTPLSK